MTSVQYSTIYLFLTIIVVFLVATSILLAFVIDQLREINSKLK